MYSRTTLLLAAGGVLLSALGAARPAFSAGDGPRIKKGFQIAPVPLNTKGLKRNLVGLGSYIVNAQGACNDCHTNPSFAEGGNPYLGQAEQINTAGYLAGGAQFGPFVSRNLTPQNGRPAGLTYDGFVAAFRHGNDHLNPGQILQVMPWPAYGKMSDGDLRAIYEYLRAIPSIPTQNVQPQSRR